METMPGEDIKASVLRVNGGSGISVGKSDVIMPVWATGMVAQKRFEPTPTRRLAVGHPVPWRSWLGFRLMQLAFAVLQIDTEIRRSELPATQGLFEVNYDLHTEKLP